SPFSIIDTTEALLVQNYLFSKSYSASSLAHLSLTIRFASLLYFPSESRAVKSHARNILLKIIGLCPYTRSCVSFLLSRAPEGYRPRGRVTGSELVLCLFLMQPPRLSAPLLQARTP